MDFESLMSQLFEVLITLIGNQRYQDLMQPIVPELIYHTIGTIALLSHSYAAINADFSEHVFCHKPLHK